MLFWSAFAGLGFAQDKPLTSVPYTPSLSTESMDRSVDPCVDFYKYACGGWIKQNPIPGDQARWDVYSKLTDENQRYLWGILEAAAQQSASRSPNEQKIGDFFRACMDTKAVEQQGTKPIEPALAKIAGLKSINDIGSYVAEQHRIGIDRSVLFGFSSDPDYDNSSQQIAFATAGGLGLPDRDYYSKQDAKSQEIRQRYLQHMTDVFSSIGESGPDAQSDAATVMAIETALADASLTRVEKRNPYALKHKMSRDALRRLTPAFDWDEYLGKLGTPAFAQINVTEPKFFDALNRELTARKLAAWRAYLRWHLLNSNAPYLSPALERAHFSFYEEYLRGLKQMPPRWKTCTRLVDRNLGEALGQVFVAKTFTPQTKADALKITGEIEAEMERDIKDLSWMSEETKHQALAKLHGIINKIGYPDKWRDYSSVHVSPSDFMGDLAHAAEFDVQRELKKIGQPVDRREWHITPPTVNAYYDPQTNDINFPAGVLQPPLFDPKMDAAPNYGDTGSTIGHELTHGFDDEGRQFDAQGNLRDWWTPRDAKAFEERTACVRDQYARYVIIDNIHINSKLTLGEDVADLGGTLLAYLAWKRATEGRNLQPVDGLTPDQRFFIGMAQWACGDTRPETKRMHALTNPHSPDEYRVNGLVPNLPEFGKAFGCKPGQPMMSEKGCRVW